MLFRCAAKRYTKACRKGRLMQHIYFAKPKQRLLWQALVLGVLAVGLMALAACGGTSAPSAAPSASTTGGGTAASPSGGTTASPGGGTAGGAVSSAAGGVKEGAKEAVGTVQGNTINMSDSLKFDPTDVTISKGETVTWQNTGATVHTATGDPSKATTPADVSLPSGAKAWDSGDIQPQGKFSHTFDTAGTYKYVCVPHESAGMVGTITVK